ncbi:hypothetical protein ccbrp13_59820 [Ktedonobacteria bacterium brp13]|nr:hypothetical protein ccbrp13_59820 [Ktedonobacteria bacterium brp13]
MKDTITKRYWEYKGTLVYTPVQTGYAGNVLEQFVSDGLTTYMHEKRGYGKQTCFIVLLETGKSPQLQQHYIYCDDLDLYMRFMRNYACVAHVFDKIVQPKIDEYERTQDRGNRIYHCWRPDY